MGGRKRAGRYVFPALTLAVVAAGVGAVVALRDDGRPDRGSVLRVLFTGETMGELEPCNCSGKMAGGLPARGGYIERCDGEFLLLDTGCVGNGARDFERLRGEAAFRAMRHMGYDAVNIGQHELWLGRDELQRLQADGVPLVSGNVRGGDGATVAPPWRIVRRCGLDVVVTGLADDPTEYVGAGLAVDPPREALGRLLPEMRRNAGVIVVLADLDRAAASELAQDFPEVTLILFRGRGDSHEPERVNRTIIASIYGEARYVGDLTLSWQSPRSVVARGEAVLLDERFPPSDVVKRLCIDWYKDAVRSRTFDLHQPGPGWSRIDPQEPDPGNGYVGAETCRPCHATQYSRWRVTQHSKAMSSLQKVGYDHSPECVVCHVVGYGASDGYRSMAETPDLGAVSCESCHGRGKINLVRDASGAIRCRVPRADETACRQCHTAKHDASFNFKDDWDKVKHEEKP